MPFRYRLSFPVNDEPPAAGLYGAGRTASLPPQAAAGGGAFHLRSDRSLHGSGIPRREGTDRGDRCIGLKKRKQAQ